MTRADVYKLIDKERDYQEEQLNNKRWKRLSKSPAEFLADIRYYTREAEDIFVETGDDSVCMNEIRKIATLCVSAIERNNTPSR